MVEATIRAERNNSHAILRITVDQLFGLYSYRLPYKEDARDFDKLIVLYGDNGSGKTTILRLLFHLLSHEDNQGHKNELTRIPFKRFAVELADGTTIEALRSGRHLIGAYRAAILKGAETLEAVELPLGPREASEAWEEGKARLKSFLKRLSKMEVALRFLSDDRRMQDRRETEEFYHRHGVPVLENTRTRLPRYLDDFVVQPVTSLSQAVDGAVRWIRQQALHGSDLGQKNVHSIYSDIAKHIAASPGITDLEDLRHKVEALIQTFDRLTGLSASYSRFGLTTKLDFGEMTATLQAAEAEKLPVLRSVLNTYAQGVEARLKALEDIHTVVENFINNINDFFGKSKSVEFDLQRGLVIHQRTKSKLEPDQLSSGEQQLLLLLCVTLAARDQASILIIDEPELSLNIKWQRKLLQSLLDCIRGSNVQLIFATHSIELIARHRSHVVRLDDRSQKGSGGVRRGQADERGRAADD